MTKKGTNQKPTKTKPQPPPNPPDQPARMADLSDIDINDLRIAPGRIIALPDNETNELTSALDQKAFRKTLERRSANREILLNWIAANLRSGVDFGRLHVRKNCQDKYACTNPSHYSKPSLWKAGAEKICGMLGLNVNYPNLERYEDSVIRGEIPKLIMVRCILTGPGGSIVGTGAGARAITDDMRDRGEERVVDFNKTLKMALKSAMIDATLRAGGLSEVFTQDLEDQFPETGVDPYTPGADPSDNAFGRATQIDVETHCPIGKEWRGREWREVDEGYLDWLISNITDKPDIVARAKREKAERLDSDPGRSAPQIHRQGSTELAGHARALANATSAADLETAWKSVPEKYRPALRKTYESQNAKLS